MSIETKDSAEVDLLLRHGDYYKCSNFKYEQHLIPCPTGPIPMFSTMNKQKKNEDKTNYSIRATKEKLITIDNHTKWNCKRQKYWLLGPLPIKQLIHRECKSNNAAKGQDSSLFPHSSLSFTVSIVLS